MKIKTALKTLIVGVIMLLLPASSIYAQQFFDVDVSANINADLYSQLSINPSTVEILQPSEISIRALDGNGNPKIGRNISLYIDGSSEGIDITQTGTTDSLGYTKGYIYSSQPGTYRICAKDITESLEIYINDCEVLNVVPVTVPVMTTLPQYTKGTSNTVVWTQASTNTYQYLVQSSRYSNFSSIQSSSSWISVHTYDFTELENSTMYFYRVKARNAYNGESNWSNTVFSTQDNESPQITLLSITDIGNNNTSVWDENFNIQIRFRVKDNIGISERRFFCVKADDTLNTCEESSTVEGDIWSVNFKLEDLEQTEDLLLYQEYSFCAEALDTVGNITRICDVVLVIPKATSNVVKPKPTEIEKIIENIEETVNEIIDNTIGKLNENQLQNITITTSTANILLALLAIISSLGFIPTFLLQLYINLMTLLGLKKKGNPTGYVYDSITKEPVKQAIVRIFNENSELVWTDVTDLNGYFKTPTFDDGEYYIKIIARNYTFPSKIVFGKDDFPLENVYHGQEFIAVNGIIPNFSIPVDSQGVEEWKKMWEKFISGTKFIWKTLHILLFVCGFLFSIYSLLVSNNLWNYLIVALYIPSIFLVAKSMFGKKDEYGIVVDDSGKRVADVIIGLKENEFGKLISKRVSDNIGRFKFIVEPGIYSFAILDSDLRLVNEQEVSNLQVTKKGGYVLKNKVVVKSVEEVATQKKMTRKRSDGLLKPLSDL